MTNIFISHTADDKEIARKLAEQIRDAGAMVWLADEKLLPGDSIANEISKAIQASDAMLLLVSGDHSTKRWLSAEVATAMAQGKRILPVILDKTAELPILLRDKLYLDLSINPDFGAAAQKIIQSLSRPIDEVKDLAIQSQRIEAERAQLEREQQQFAMLKELREVEIRSMTFSAMFVVICLSAAVLLYVLERRPNGFDFLWTIIGILIGAATVEVGHYLRSKIQIKNLEREVRQ